MSLEYEPASEPQDSAGVESRHPQPESTHYANQNPVGSKLGAEFRVQGSQNRATVDWPRKALRISISKDFVIQDSAGDESRLENRQAVNSSEAAPENRCC